MNTTSQQRQPGTLEQVESWLDTARQLGYRVRYDHFGGTGGGVCEFSEQKWVFMDVSLSAIEHLEMLQESIPQDRLFQTVSPQITAPQTAEIKRAA